LGERMHYLLDTHVVVWATENPARLPPAVQEILKDPASFPLAITPITPWEIAMLSSRGRLRLAQPVGDWLSAALRREFTALLSLSAEISVESCQLPGHFHADPADRIIVASARVHGLTLITADAATRAYPHVRTLWD